MIHDRQIDNLFSLKKQSFLIASNETGNYIIYWVAVLERPVQNGRSRLVLVSVQADKKMLGTVQTAIDAAKNFFGREQDRLDG
ncbi:hypothetical protein BpHYR1_049160, partial [Brachionus plicatilis]